MSSSKFQWKSGDLVFDSDITKSKLHVIHYASDSDLPKSVLSKVTDSVGQSIFRHALNESLSNGKSEMHSFIAAYKALEQSGYQHDDDENWVLKNGGPAGVLLPGEEEQEVDGFVCRPQVLNTDTDEIAKYIEYLEELNKANPTSTNVHVNRPLGSDETETKDDPGTQFVNPEQKEILGATIQNPFDGRDKAEETKIDREAKDDPGTQDVDPPQPNYAGAPNYAAITSFQGSGNQDPTFIYHKVSKRISGSSNIHLNKEGVRLASELGVCIADKGCFDVLYSSPLNRGKETAHEILEACPHTTYARPNPALQPWHLGVFEGKQGDDAKDGIGNFVEKPDARPPGKGADGKDAETFNEAKTRQLNFWSDLYKEWENDPTLKIGVVCHSRGLALLQAWVDDDCPVDFDVDTDDIHNPDDDPHATVYRWHKDKIKEVDVEDDDPLKPGIYPILHSLTDDDGDDGNEQLEKGGPGSGPHTSQGSKVAKSNTVVQLYLPPIEVQRAAKSAYDLGCAVIGITDPLSDGTGLNEAGVLEVAKYFNAVESHSTTETTRNAWGGLHAGKWAQRVIRKIQRDYKAWVGIDLDGTISQPLESYDGTKIGNPIEGKFFEKVKQAVKDGKNIKILTARVANDPNGKIADAIKAWTLKYLGKELPVTNEKDPGMTEIWDDKAHHPSEINKAGSGVMVAFSIDPVIANKLKVKGGEEPSEMHVTLVYLGKGVDDEKIKALTTMLKGFAGTFAPINATLRGPMRFLASESSDGKDVCVANVESTSLHQFHDDLLNKIESLGIESKSNFSFNPHVTIQYIDPKDDLPTQRIDPISVTFKSISLWNNKDITDFPLSGTAVAKSSGYGTIIECVSEGDIIWVHVTCDDGTRVALQFNQSQFDQQNFPIQIGTHVRWDNDNAVFDCGTEFPLVSIAKATGSKEGQWVTINGQHILIGSDGKPLAGNPRVMGRKVSAKVEIARNNAVLTGKHEQDIADRAELKLSKAIGIPRTKNNSAYDLRDDSTGIEVKTMVTGTNDKITMGKEALGRKLAEQRAEGLKVFTVVADMRGRTQAKYYVKEGVGSFRIGSMVPISLSDLKELVTR